MTRPPPRSTLFPYTTLFRSRLTLYDVSDTTNPQKVGSVDIESPVSGMATSGNYAYVIAQLSGIVICDLSIPADPRVVAHAPLYRPREFFLDLLVSGNYAYAGAWTNGLRIYDV